MTTAVNEAHKDVLLLAKQNVANFKYTSCYCEENIYHLCKNLSEQGVAANDASDIFVVFISNPIQQVPLWQQRNSSQTDGFCMWDYHVICIQKTSKPDEFQVWDLDTTLSLPVVAKEYVTGALRPDISFNKKYSRLFRVVRAPLFLKFFASDRRHMKDKQGRWLASPPPYTCIVAEDGEVHNLLKYNRMMEEQVLHTGNEVLDILQGEKFGVVLSQDGLLKLFGCPRPQAISVSNHLQVT